MRRGTLVDVAGRPAVRLALDLAHPADRVWRAVTDPDELRTWFPQTLAYRPRVGSPVDFTDDPALAPTTGTVLAWEPPQRFAFTWGDDELWFEVSAADAPGTGGPAGSRLVLTDVLELPDAAARNAAGWEVCLDVLVAHLGGATTDGPRTAGARGRWERWFAAYAEAGFPTGAPVPAGPADPEPALPGADTP